MINGDVILQRIGAGHVIIISILPAPDQSSGLIFLAGYWLEFDVHKAVLEDGVGIDAPQVGSVPGLFQNIRFARRGGISNHGPFWSSFASHAALPLAGKRANLFFIEVERAGEGS